MGAGVRSQPAHPGCDGSRRLCRLCYTGAQTQTLSEQKSQRSGGEEEETDPPERAGGRRWQELEKEGLLAAKDS